MVARTSLGVDKALTRFAILNKNPEGVYIADMVLPKIGVMGRTGKLYTVNSGFRFASPSQGLKRLGGSAFKRFSMGVAQSDVYNLEEYGNEFPVDDIDAELFIGSVHVAGAYTPESTENIDFVVDAEGLVAVRVYFPTTTSEKGRGYTIRKLK